MSEQTFWSVVGIFALIVGAISGALWKHVIEDAKVRERLASLETDSETTKAEVKTLRERWHDFRDDTLRDVWKIFEDWKRELIERFERKGK